MVTQRWLRAALLLAGLGACTGTRAPVDQPPDEKPFVAGIELALSAAALQRGELIDSANFATLQYLHARARVTDMLHTGGVTARLVNPHGELQYVVGHFFSPDPNVKSTPSMYGEAAEVLPAKTVPGGYVIDFAVPIAGTRLHTIPARGVWEVEVEVEGYTQLLRRNLTVRHAARE